MSNQQDRSGPISGCVGLIVLLGLGYCTFHGGSAPPAPKTSNNALVADTMTPPVYPSVPQSSNTDAKSSEVADAENTLKLIINLNNRLCADIVNVRPVQGSVYHVTCIENIGGKRTIDYLVDGSNNSVRRI